MDNNVNCFVFRTSEELFVKEELKEGRLRQGWSPEGTSLQNSDGKERSKEDWSSAYKRKFGKEPSPRRHSILRRMLDMKEDDFVLCPKCPKRGFFTIAVVSKGYNFKFSPTRDDNYAHIIEVKDMRDVSHNHNENSQAIADLFRSAYFWSPVVQVQDYRRGDVISAAERLLRSKNTETSVNPDGIRKQRLDNMRVNAAEHFVKDVRIQMSPQQFESTVKEAFTRRGYEIIRSNDWRAGGDADHVFAVPMPGFGDKETTHTPILIVQVKHKQGVDVHDQHGLDQLLQWEPRDDESIIRRVLFSSANKFTDDCINRAKDNDVTLICDIDAGLFMLFDDE